MLNKIEIVKFESWVTPDEQQKQLQTKMDEVYAKSDGGAFVQPVGRPDGSTWVYIQWHETPEQAPDPEQQ